MAATLATGGVLSHRAAGALWGIRRSGAIEVTAGAERLRKNVLVHRAQIPPDERTIRDGIPTTTVPRTLLDLATILKPHQLERAINEAHFAGLTDPLSLDALLARYPRRQGTPQLRHALSKRRALLRSDLEAAFLAYLDAHNLPRPQMNITLEGFECDGVYEEQRVIIELDGGGHRGHGDAERDRRLAAAGWTTIRVVGSHLIDRSLADDLRKILTRVQTRHLTRIRA
jgi:very-short-patch-repair endonuclease